MSEKRGCLSKECSDTLTFVEYKDFEYALESKQNLKQLSNKFDFLSILLLDSTTAKVLFKFDPELKEDFYYVSMARKPNMSTTGFRTDLTRLKDVLLSTRARNMIVNCSYGDQSLAINNLCIESPVYTNGDSAVIKISSDSHYSVHFVTFFNGVVQMNLLESVIED